MLMSFPGTIGIYQGEELGQTETELVFEELTDPPAIRFWPAVKGRDAVSYTHLTLPTTPYV